MREVISPTEQLEILQRIDSYRKWHTLEDKRVCVLCDRVITGGEIAIEREADGTVALHCPTEGCDGGPDAWFYHSSATAPAATPAAPRRAEFSFL